MEYFGSCLNPFSWLHWFTLYLNNRSQQVHTTTSTLMRSTVLFGVLQGLVLGPILFLLYTAHLLQLFKCHHLTPHEYGHCQPSDTDRLTQLVSVCTDEVSVWMNANRLLLNPAKTEVLWCASSWHEHLIPTQSVRVGDISISPVTAVWDLGVYMDAAVSMRTQVTNTVRACFSALRQTCSV